MIRTVTIAGKTVELETGIPMTPNGSHLLRGQEKSPFRLLIEEMQPGESVYLPLSKKQMATANSAITNASKALGKKYARRASGAGYRIYCLTQPAPPPTQVRQIAPGARKLLWV